MLEKLSKTKVLKKCQNCVKLDVNYKSVKIDVLKIVKKNVENQRVRNNALKSVKNNVEIV
jgi:hypothetical protein